MTSLRRRMTEDMQVRSLSPQTQATYVQQVSLFARHFNRSPELLGPEEIRSYQVYLTNERKLAPSSIILAVAALRFLYKITLHKDWSLTEVIPTPKKPQKLPIVPSPEEVLHFLGCVWNIKHRTVHAEIGKDGQHGLSALSARGRRATMGRSTRLRVPLTDAFGQCFLRVRHSVSSCQRSSCVVEIASDPRCSVL